VSPLAFGAGLFPTEPLPAMVRLAQAAEALGFGHAWIGASHLIWREAYVTPGAAAVATARVVLGTGVTNVLTRDPTVVASAVATLADRHDSMELFATRVMPQLAARTG
jgi:5,10-methylenetetrahydromethanopterin reductase